MLWGGKKGSESSASLTGGRFCGNAQTLADYGPPGVTLGDMTLRDCGKGLGIVAIETISFGVVRFGSALGWRAGVLVASPAAARAARSSQVERAR